MMGISGMEAVEAGGGRGVFGVQAGLDHRYWHTYLPTRYLDERTDSFEEGGRAND